MRMSPELRLVIILALTPFFIAFIHALLSRIMRLFNRFVSSHVVVLSAITIGHIPVFLIIWFFALRAMGDTKSLIAAMAYSIVVYETLAYSYFHLFNMSETARRIKILLDIYRGGGLKISGLSASYNAEEMLANRLDRLVAMKQVSLLDGRYRLKSKLLYNAAKIISAWGRLLGLPRPESLYKKKKP